MKVYERETMAIYMMHKCTKATSIDQVHQLNSMEILRLDFYQRLKIN